MFTDELWTELKMIMLKIGFYDKPFHRLRVGCPWRDLPKVFDIGMEFINDFMNGLVKKS
jgi:transposase